MLSVLSAEATKLLRHRATWFLVWIYPIGIAVGMLIAIAVGVLGGDDPGSEPSTEDWLWDTAIIWQFATSNFGRYLIAAYAAVAFAGEYGWNTWKLIVPHRSRAGLIAGKYATVLLLLLFALFVAGLLTVGLTLLEDRLTGDPIPPGIGLGGLIEVHATAIAAALMPLLYTLAYASLAAILTRSMVAALVISVVVATLEQIFLFYAPALYALAPGIVGFLYHGLPGYHLGNLYAWIAQGEGSAINLPGAGAPYAWQASLAICAAWTAGLAALTFWRFGRQDIN